MSGTKRIPALDSLRAIAILWVVWHHLLGRYIPRGWNGGLTRLLEAGNSGVDLFFVLSGFLIARIILVEWSKAGGLSLGRFWYRRWMRTLPAYYVVLALIACSDWLVPPDRPWGRFPAYLVFLQNYLTDTDHVRFAWSWSLCVEEWFYLVLPLLVWAFGRSLPAARPATVLRLLAVGAFAVSVCARLAEYPRWSAGISGWDEAYRRLYPLTHCRLDGIATGLFIATLPRAKNNPQLWGAVLLVVVLLAALVFADHGKFLELQRFAVYSVLFGVFVYASAGDNRWSSFQIPGAALVADLSYSLYLTHPIFTKAVERVLPGRSVVLQVAVFFLAAFAASACVRYAVEVPLLKLRDRRRRATAVAAGPSPRAGSAVFGSLPEGAVCR